MSFYIKPRTKSQIKYDVFKWSYDNTKDMSVPLKVGSINIEESETVPDCITQELDQLDREGLQGWLTDTRTGRERNRLTRLSDGFSVACSDIRKGIELSAYDRDALNSMIAETNETLKALRKAEKALPVSADVIEENRLTVFDNAQQENNEHYQQETPAIINEYQGGY